MYFNLMRIKYLVENRVNKKRRIENTTKNQWDFNYNVIRE